MVRMFLPMFILFCFLKGCSPNGCGGTTDPGPVPTGIPYSVFAESQDGGQNWTLTDSLYFAKKLYAGSWTADNTIFIIAGQDTASKATIWRSTDFGGDFTWTSVLTLIDNGGAFNDVAHTPGYANLVAVTSGGQIFLSVNNGATWGVRNSPGPPLNAAHFFAQQDIGVAVGNGGRILRTTDAGVNWASVSSGTTQDLFGVHCIGSGSANDTIVGVGALSTVVRSTDAGETWTASTLPVATTLKATYFSGNSFGRFGLAVGNSPIVYKTTDNGASWYQTNFIANGNTEDVIVSDDGNRCLLVSNQNELSHNPFSSSTDRGETWQQGNEVNGAYWYKMVYKTFGPLDYGFAVGIPY